MPKTAVVTGAGSGVGRAAAIRLVKEGWSVALIGRREEALRETAALTNDANRTFVVPCDVADPAAVLAMAGQVLGRFGEVDALVHAAGTNIPKRPWDVLTVEDYRQVIDINLNGAFYCVRAFLPTMRRKGEGTIVLIVSDAGIVANAKAGPAYVASKFAERGLRNRSMPRNVKTASAARRCAPATSTRRSSKSVRPRRRRKHESRCFSRRTWPSA